MDKIKRFENLLEKYLRYSKVYYFVGCYDRIYKLLHHLDDGKYTGYEIDYGRLWGMYELLMDDMTEEDRYELLHLIINV